ncbi:MAG TPA: hypothetical protein VMV73_03455 [Candidatus Dormibacteraeota bacterium]|nr:hypothetical protein [Candidatus Dormibacteraeota bacterium]
MRLFESTLGLLLAGGLLLSGTAASALADGHGHGNHGRNQQHSQPQYAQPQYGQPQYGQPQYGQNQYGQNQNGDGNNNQGEDNHGNPQGCINPAGHQRGWCKNNQNGQNNGQYGQNTQVQGLILGVSNNNVTILQGLSRITFDAGNALRNNNTNGPLYITRSITAYGYYDNNRYFHANSIR